MPKAAPFSMRLSEVTDQLVIEEAKRTRRANGALSSKDSPRRRSALAGFPGSRSAAATGTAVPG